MKIPVGERAVLSRLNRRLKKDERVVKKSRQGTRAYAELGEFYMLDLSISGTGFVVEKDVDIDALARELGVLGVAEEIRSD